MNEHGGKRGGAGRPKGSSNETNKKVRNFIKEILTGQQDKFLKELEKLEGKQFIDAWTTLIEYSVPKLQRTELVGDEEKPLVIDVTKLDEQTIRGLLKGVDEGDSEGGVTEA